MTSLLGNATEQTTDITQTSRYHDNENQVVFALLLHIDSEINRQILHKDLKIA